MGTGVNEKPFHREMKKACREIIDEYLIEFKTDN